MAHQISLITDVEKKIYAVFEHTADIGIKISGKSLKSIFQRAGLAIFQLSSEKLQNSKNRKKLIIKQRADKLDELLVNWLNELLSLSAAKGLIFEKISIKKIDQQKIEAEVTGADISNYKVNTEIKAATYHQLKIAKNKNGWQAQIILDV
ncbi:MAG: archease [Candidatus Omnitrophica bacterium]|nr:archease [Candidatus Omnitrophota bacterium]